MRYIDAVRVGSQRAEKARLFLAQFISSARSAIFLKDEKEGEFEPVDEENLVGIIKSPDGRYAMVAICDSEGNAKALSYWLEIQEVEQIYRKIRQTGVKEYSGPIRAPI